jgi:hypothetical protein
LSLVFFFSAIFYNHSKSLGSRDSILSTLENPLFLKKNFNQLFSHTKVSETCENPDISSKDGSYPLSSSHNVSENELKQPMNDTSCHLSPCMKKNPLASQKVTIKKFLIF